MNGEIKVGHHDNTNEDVVFQSFRRSIQTIAVQVHHQKHPDNPPKRNHRRTSTELPSCPSVRRRSRAPLTRSYTEGTGPSNLRKSSTSESSDGTGATAVSSRSRHESEISRRSSTGGLPDDHRGRRDGTIGAKGSRSRRRSMISFLEVDFSIRNNHDIFAERDRRRGRSGRHSDRRERAKKEVKRRNSFDLSDTFLGGISYDDFHKKESGQSSERRAETILEDESKATKKRLLRKSHSFYHTRSSPSPVRASISTKNKLHRRMMPKRHSDEAWIRDVTSRDQPAKPAKDSSKIRKRRGKRHKLGDTALSKTDCVLLGDDKDACGSRETYLISVSSLSVFDSAFVKRSNGQLTYAILVDRFFDEDAEHGGKRGEECMKFVLDSKGATKTIRKGIWLDMIRMVNEDDNEKCNK